MYGPLIFVSTEFKFTDITIGCHTFFKQSVSPQWINIIGNDEIFCNNFLSKTGNVFSFIRKTNF